MAYIDGFAAAAPTASKADYIEHIKVAGRVFKDHGALRVVDCWGDDVPDGKLTSFPMAVKKEAGETVVFGWIEWPSRAARDAGMKSAMEDKRLTGVSMPFDGRRMIMGGFEVLADS